MDIAAFARKLRKAADVLDELTRSDVIRPRDNETEETAEKIRKRVRDRVGTKKNGHGLTDREEAVLIAIAATPLKISEIAKKMGTKSESHYYTLLPRLIKLKLAKRNLNGTYSASTKGKGLVRQSAHS